MDKTKFIGIIPARYASTRFPGKPLAILGGMTMIERVYRQVTKILDRVAVATDDERIFQAVERFGGTAVMTSNNHRSGTDRCHEAYLKLGGCEDVIINIQGDEPFIQPNQLLALMSCFEHEGTEIATLVKPFPHEGSVEQLENPNSPKVVINRHHEALYFSRSVVPFLRGVPYEEWPRHTQYYTHIGLYAYRASALAQITQLQQTPLELAESLEQLRWIENGLSIRVAITHTQTFGIDTPQDLARAEEYLNAINHD